MHTLPNQFMRVLEVYTLAQARYFTQAQNSLSMRINLIRYCLEG